jgi:hypothetical protein
MLFERQKRLLVLLNALGGRVPNLDFQKLLFLYCQEVVSPPPYEFIPYKFGAFSFTSYADRRKLLEHDLIEGNEQVWILTSLGRMAIQAFRVGELLPAFVRRYQGVRGDALVADTYRRYPYYATRSEIVARVLRGDAASLQRVENARQTAVPAPVSTIGYEGHTLESYLNRLVKAGVTLLCDVRRNPLSRKYGFSKSTLAKSCEGVGVRYEHLPDLGIASDRRQTLETQADYDALFAAYRRDDLPTKGPALAILLDWIHAGERVALTCYEHLPQQCHRHCVADAVGMSLGATATPVHL